jgi:hypothetical protein
MPLYELRRLCVSRNALRYRRGNERFTDRPQDFGPPPFQDGLGLVERLPSRPRELRLPRVKRQVAEQADQPEEVLHINVALVRRDAEGGEVLVHAANNSPSPFSSKFA